MRKFGIGSLIALAFTGCLTGPRWTGSPYASGVPAAAQAVPAAVVAGKEAAPETTVPGKPGDRVVGYYESWTAGRKGSCKFPPSDIPAHLFTHIDFAFAEIDANFKLVPEDPADSVAGGPYAQFNALKKKNPKLRTFISVGGWAFNDPPNKKEWIFSAMAEKPENRATFIQSVIEFCRKHEFDGLDVDWEYPSEPTRGGRPGDTENYNKLLTEMRAAFEAEAQKSGKERLLLTIAATGGYYAVWFDLPNIHKPLDWINLMSYDFHGSWEKNADHNAPMIEHGVGIPGAISLYRSFGVPADKIVLGMATYGRTFGGVKDSKPESPATGPGLNLECSGGEGTISYFEVLQQLKTGKYKVEWDEKSLVPYAYDEKAKVWFSYDDEKAFDKKLDFIERNSLGGAMFWAIDLDDRASGFPLISRVSKRLRH